MMYCNAFRFIPAFSQSSYRKRKEPTTMSIILIGYRLCVFASGSLITDILNCLILIISSCLHFGQNNGKFISSVSLRIFNLVSFPHIGHNIHCSSCTSPPQIKPMGLKEFSHNWVAVTIPIFVQPICFYSFIFRLKIIIDGIIRTIAYPNTQASCNGTSERLPLIA